MSFSIQGEDIESFVGHHGFVLKSFEEMYIVKSGPFLRQEGDPLGKRSPLVGTKRSHKIKLDVCFAPVSNAISKEEVSDSLKVAGTKRVSPEKPDMDMSDSAKPAKVSDETQLELQPVRGSQEMDQLATIIPERPIDVQVIPLLPLPSPPISRVPLTQVSDAPRVVTSKLSAPLSLAPSSNSEVPVTSSVIASSVQKVVSTKENEVEMIPVKKSRESMELFREKLKPIFRLFILCTHEKLSTDKFIFWIFPVHVWFAQEPFVESGLSVQTTVQYLNLH